MSTTAREIIQTLASRLNTDKVDEETKGLFHFDLEGEGGGQFSVKLENLVVQVEEGLVGEPSCVVTTKAQTFVDIELGKVNPQMAFMMGKIKLSNIGEMLKFLNAFHKFQA